MGFFSLGAGAASAELATVSFTRLLQNLNIFLLLLKMAPQEISIHTGRARFPCKASAWNSTAQTPNAPEQPDPVLQTSQWCLSPATFCGLLGNQCHQYHVDFENLALVHWIENRTAISPQATKQWIPRTPLRSEAASLPAQAVWTSGWGRQLRKCCRNWGGERMSKLAKTWTREPWGFSL